MVRVGRLCLLHMQGSPCGKPMIGMQAGVSQQALSNMQASMSARQKGARLCTWLTFQCQEGQCGGDRQCSQMQGMHNIQPMK